jgi:ribonuclease T1
MIATRRCARSRFQAAAAGFLLAAAVVLAPPAAARASPAADLPPIAAAELPAEGREVLRKIQTGERLRYERDGVVFGNREKLLPPHPRGYYHEYTVPTPNVKGRGARRIVCGGPKQAPEACYYSDDHYASFRRIRE